MRLNQTFSVTDPAVALEGDNGVFELTSPNGEKFQVTCEPGRSITNIRYLPRGQQHQQQQPWRIKKVGESAEESPQPSV